MPSLECNALMSFAAAADTAGPIFTSSCEPCCGSTPCTLPPWRGFRFVSTPSGESGAPVADRGVATKPLDGLGARLEFVGGEDTPLVIDAEATLPGPGRLGLLPPDVGIDLDAVASCGGAAGVLKKRPENLFVCAASSTCESGRCQGDLCVSPASQSLCGREAAPVVASVVIVGSLIASF